MAAAPRGLAEPEEGEARVLWLLSPEQAKRASVGVGVEGQQQVVETEWGEEGIPAG